jgi:hypothetical protein
VLSTVLSMRVPISIYGTSWRRFGLVAQLAVLLFTALAAADLAGGRNRLQLYLRAIVIGSAPISLYGIAQYFGWDPWLPKDAYHVGEGFWTIVRPPGTLGYVSYFANYMVFAVLPGPGALQPRRRTLVETSRGGRRKSGGLCDRAERERAARCWPCWWARPSSGFGFAGRFARALS